jgi:hypothetical protein
LAVALGAFGEPLKRVLDNATEVQGSILELQGVLAGLSQAIRDGALDRFEAQVLAVAFSDLLDQAETLLRQEYLVAAGATARAVLEQKLRSLSGARACSPTGKTHYQINDFNLALYKANVIDKVQMKLVDSMASVGNSAAHGLPIRREDVERMVKDVRSFVALFA